MAANNLKGFNDKMGQAISKLDQHVGTQIDDFEKHCEGLGSRVSDAFHKLKSGITNPFDKDLKEFEDSLNQMTNGPFEE